MWWNVLIIPSGYRYKVKMGQGNFDLLAADYKSLEYRAKIKFACDTGVNPEKLTYSDWKSNQQLRDFVQQDKANWSKKNQVDLMPNQVIGMIKSTEPDHLDVLVDLEAEDHDEFAMSYGGGEEGGIDILNDGLSRGLMLVRSSLGELKRGLQQDYRYHKLSDEGKKQAMKRVELESRMEDAKQVEEWIDRLEMAIKLKSRRAKADKDNFASVFDGLK